jgi:hypothetical protein
MPRTGIPSAKPHRLDVSAARLPHCWRNEHAAIAWLERSQQSHYVNFGSAIAGGIAEDFDDIQQKGAATYSDFYTSEFSLYLAGPIDSNFGVWAQAIFPVQSPTYDQASNTWSTTTSTTQCAPWIRYYNGNSSSSFLFARVGQIGIDGFEGSDAPIQSDVSDLINTSVNGSSMGGRGAELGYSLKNDALTAYAFYDNNGNTGNSPLEAIQYLHFIGKHDSSVQAIYFNGSAPLSGNPANVTATGSTATDGWDSYNQLQLFGNYRSIVSKNDAVNMLVGWSNGKNHNIINPSGSTVVAGSSFNVRRPP